MPYPSPADRADPTILAPRRDEAAPTDPGPSAEPGLSADTGPSADPGPSADTGAADTGPDLTPAAEARSRAENSPRWQVAQQVADAIRPTWGRQLQAIGVHGSLAHGDDVEGSDVHIVVVTRFPGAGPAPTARRVLGVVVDVGVIGAEEYLRHARTLTTSWPLAADRYLTTKPLYDPDRWLPRLRDAHLARLAGAAVGEFSTLAREAWCRASTAHARAHRLVDWYATDVAMLVVGEARLGVAVVDGLLTRTYFRNTADAVRRAGVASAGIMELAARLAEQAEELARRGRPVDADPAQLY